MTKQTSQWFNFKIHDLGLRPVDIHRLCDIAPQTVSSIKNGTDGRGADGKLVAFLEAYTLLSPGQRIELHRRLDVQIFEKPVDVEKFDIGGSSLFLEKYRGNTFVLYFPDKTDYSFSFDREKRRLVITISDELIDHNDLKLALSTNTIHIEKPAASNELIFTFGIEGHVDILYDSTTQNLIVHSVD
ncbi:hypothetical protein ACTU44_21810 (plasmid) [Thalassospira sp. SM2505]